MIKKVFENRQLDTNIDTIKFVIKMNIYDDILKLFKHKKDDENSITKPYIIDNTIKIQLFKEFNYTHITVFGLKSHNKRKDIKRNKMLNKLINHLLTIPKNKIFLKKLDLAIDYKVHPSTLFMYKTYTNNNNKYIRLHELKDDKSYKDCSLYLHDFQYYKANIYKLGHEIYDLGISLFDKIKVKLAEEFELYYNENCIGKNRERMFTKYIKNLYSKLGLEFIKYENNNFYLYVPKDTYESNAYKSEKDYYKRKGLHFKPATTKSHTIKYDKKNKVFEKEKIELIHDLTRVEFVINFKDKLITNVDDITKIIYKELNKVFITDSIIEKTTLKSFMKEYNNNLFNDTLKDRLIDDVFELLKKFI